MHLVAKAISRTGVLIDSPERVTMSSGQPAVGVFSRRNPESPAASGMLAGKVNSVI